MKRKYEVKKIMQKSQILQEAIRRNLNMKQIGEDCASAFALVHQCIGSICTMDLTEEEKKEKLIRSMQSFWRGKGRYIAGCKREYVQNIVAGAFGIRSEKNVHLGAQIQAYTFQELYLYYCYIERIAKVDTYFAKVLINSSKTKNHMGVRKIEERQEQKKREEKERDELSKEKRWEKDIAGGQQDMLYYQDLMGGEIYDAEEEGIIAELLKKYWVAAKKWEGDKVSKKQVIKIENVKKILLQHGKS